jgi:hypothetical protein
MGDISHWYVGLQGPSKASADSSLLRRQGCLLLEFMEASAIAARDEGK